MEGVLPTVQSVKNKLWEFHGLFLLKQYALKKCLISLQAKGKIVPQKSHFKYGKVFVQELHFWELC